MKSVIDGKLYNTTTAKEIAEIDNISQDVNYGSFGYFCESIHLTKNGAWFLYGYGGCQTQYNNSGTITPLSNKEAMEWLEKHDEVEALLKHFSDAITDA